SEGVSSPGSRAWVNGPLYRETTPSGVGTTSSHDDLERLTLIKGRGHVEEDRTYDPGATLGKEISNAYYMTDRVTYEAGRVILHETFNCTLADGVRTGTKRYAYTGLGQVAWRWGNAVQPVEYKYNELGQREEMSVFQAG